MPSCKAEYEKQHQSQLIHINGYDTLKSVWCVGIANDISSVKGLTACSLYSVPTTGTSCIAICSRFFLSDRPQAIQEKVRHIRSYIRH